MKYEKRVLSVIVGPATGDIFDENATIISIENQGGGEYLKISQEENTPGHGYILLDKNEWVAIKEALNEMFSLCRD